MKLGRGRKEGGREVGGAIGVDLNQIDCLPNPVVSNHRWKSALRNRPANTQKPCDIQLPAAAGWCCVALQTANRPPNPILHNSPQSIRSPGDHRVSARIVYKVIPACGGKQRCSSKHKQRVARARAAHDTRQTIRACEQAGTHVLVRKGGGWDAEPPASPCVRRDMLVVPPEWSVRLCAAVELQTLPWCWLSP